MRLLLKLIVACFLFSAYTMAFAYYKDAAPMYVAYQSSSCSSSGGCPDKYCSECECTDPGCGSKGYNNCLTKRECCEAFGNVGAR